MSKKQLIKILKSKKTSFLLVGLNVFLLSVLILTATLTVTKAASSIAEYVKGRILLQVEQNGEAWYVNPVDSKRYYLGRPADAFDIMRNLGLGITDNDLSQISIGTIVVKCTIDDDCSEEKVCSDGSIYHEIECNNNVCEQMAFPGSSPCGLEAIQCSTEQDCIDSGECSAGLECTCSENKCYTGLVCGECTLLSPPVVDWCKNGTITQGPKDSCGCRRVLICNE